MAEEFEQPWLRPERIAEPEGATVSAPAMFELRPLSLGEVLDRTFALYRSRFWLFAGIAAVSAAVQVAMQAISLTTTHALLRGGLRGLGHPMPLRSYASVQAWALGIALIFLLVSAITQAATSLALSQVYLSQPAGAKEALRATLQRWYRWIAIALWQTGSMLWVPLVALVPGFALVAFGARSGNRTLAGGGALLLLLGLLGGFPVGFILYLRNALAVPSAVVEHLGIRAAMRRSKVLTAGTKGRIFVVLLIALCLYYVVAILESPATLLMLLAPKQQHFLAQAIALAISFLGHTAVAPIALIGLTLVYFDQRVRKEAFDLQLLLESGRGPAPRTGATAEAAGAAAPERFAPLG